MAESNFWLPAGKESLSFEPSSLSFPTEFPYEFDSLGSNSDLNSPVESVVSSTESADSSDDDELFMGLAQQLAWTSLCETERSPTPCFNSSKFEKKCVKAGSPQSTLSGIDTWFRPESPSSQMKSPPMAVFGAVHAAAREAARLKLRAQTSPFQSNDPFVRGFMGTRSSVPVKSIDNVDYGLFSNHGCARNLALAAQTQQVRQDLVLQALCASSWSRQAKAGWTAPPHRKPEIQNRERNIGIGSGRCSGTAGLYQCAWLPPPPPPPNASAVRCIHPGGPAVKRASSGTGVFLPRRYVNPSECRQKQGSPAIRFPDEMINPAQAPFNGCLSPGFDSMLARRNNSLSPLTRSLRGEAAINQELHLPQEWTY